MIGQPASKPACPRCGTEVPPDAPQGYCLKCLFALGTAKPEDRDQESGISSQQSEARDQKAEPGTPTASACRPLTSDFRPLAFGDYELLEEIARGGMGVVYKARQISLGRMVAVKMLLFGNHSGKEQAQRFRAEAALAASLQHPNIVAIHEVGAHEGQPFFAMDLVEGQSLARLAAGQPLPAARAARYVKIVAEAIHYAHERGILHRDLKPSNVLIDSFDQPRVTDFGLAKRIGVERGSELSVEGRDPSLNSQLTPLSTDFTLSGQVLGSPNYMPPEQAAAKRGLVGCRSDVYSLGAILYHLLTGRPPFVGETLTDTLQDVVNKEPVSPRLLNPSVPPDLETLCLKCLEKEPARRYPTAQALAEDLDRFLKAEPIRARRIGPTARLWRWCRRKPALASFVAATALLLLAILIGSPITAYHINHERRRAERGELDARQKAYASDMNLANQALAQNKFGRVRYLLDRHRPGFVVPASAGSASGPSLARLDRLKAGLQTDLRGWEWRYLWQHGQSDVLFTLCQQSNPICSLAISPDGNRLAVGEVREGGLSIWDLQKREEIIRFPKDEGSVFAVFSPRSRLLAFARGVPSVSLSSPSRVQLWDGDTQRIVAELPLESPCRGLAFSGDGESLAALSTGEEGQLTLWKVPEGKRLARHPALKVRYGYERTFAVARDMSVAAYVVEENRLRLVDLRSGRERWMTNLSDEYVIALAISPDGKILASAGGFDPSPIRLWEVASGKAIGSLEGHRGYAYSFVFWPDGKTMASVGSDQMIRFWNLDELRPSRPPLGHKSGQWSLALLPDNQRLLSGCGDGSVCVWDTAARPRASTHVRLPGSFIAWSFATNGQTVLTCDRHGRVAQRQGSQFAEERLFEIGTNVSAATFIPHRSMVVVAGLGASDPAEAPVRFSSLSRIQVWDLPTRSFLHELTLSNRPPRDWLCLAQGNRLIIGDAANQSLHEWDLTTWEKVRTWRAPAHLCAGAVSPDGRWCITAGLGGAVMINDLITGRTRVEKLEIKEPYNITFSPDGKLLWVANGTGFPRIYDAVTLQPCVTLRGSQSAVQAAAFSPDGQRLAIGSTGKDALTLWDVASHEELLTLEGQGSMFDPPAFSPDGNVLGAMNTIGVLHLWRAPSWAEIEAAEKESRK